MSKATLIAEPINGVSSPKTAIHKVPYSWKPNSKYYEKYENAYRIVQSFSSTDQFYQFFDYLHQVNPEFYRDHGGEILFQVLTADADKYVDSFDRRYLRLINLFSNFDLNAANEFHSKAKKLYRASSNSLVRYDRIISSIEYAARINCNYQIVDKDNFIFSILPMSGGWQTQQYTFQQKDDFINAVQGNTVILGKIDLENKAQRKINPLSALDDCEIAESKWLNRPNINSVDRIECFSLPHTRISKEPTGIAFCPGNDWRYLNASADMYHYFRVSGKTIFGSVSKKRQQAYVLPRNGVGNYYCTLLNRLPALYAYHLLGLDLPIISTYKLNETEVYFAKKMGIDINRIEYDEESQILVENAIVPMMPNLKIIFSRFCMSLPKSDSPFGRHIYISRANAADRVMANEPELEQLLISYGFDVVAMEKYDLEEQMAIAGSADLIVAPHGAGLTNMIFSKKGTGIFELVPEYYMQSSFKQLAIDCGHKYGMLIGKKVTCESFEGESISWMVDIDRFSKVLGDILKQKVRPDF